MNTLRVLLVEGDRSESQRIASMLGEDNHILPAEGLEEALEAVFVEKFDAVLLGSPVEADELAEFTQRLRLLEKNQHLVRTPVLSISQPPAEWQSNRVKQGSIDAYLPERFEVDALSEAVRSLSVAVAGGEERVNTDGAQLAVFEPEKFQAQVCHDTELLVEIIDLFLAESPEQVTEMNQALACADYGRLSRVAHTIKGSLGSLHAPMARCRAQELETAARDQEDQVCRFSLAALQQDLEILRPELLSLRQSV